MERTDAWAVPAGNGRWRLMAARHENGRYWEARLGQPLAEGAALVMLRSFKNRVIGVGP